jgi:hypothetical protein
VADEHGWVSPSREQIARMVTAANTAPSGDNCQPWHFHLAGGELSITHDAARARHLLNHNDFCSLLALGCVLEALEIAASVEGLRCEPQLSLDAPRGGPWARVRFARSEAPPHPLAAALFARCADRRLHRGGSTAHPVFAAIRRDGQRFDDAALHVIAGPDPALMRYLLDSDRYVWRHPQIVDDILPWIRFTREEILATRDGIGWASLGFDLPEIPGLGLTRWRPLPRIIDRLHLFSVARRWFHLTLRSAAALLCVTVTTPRKASLVSAGRLAYLAWVRLNQAGFGVQPMTIQAMPIYHVEVGGLPEGTLPEFHEHYRRGRAVVARGFNYPDAELPVWMFRTGQSSPLPASLKSLRLRTEDILTIDTVDGAR